jgi:hypothetical protein
MMMAAINSSGKVSIAVPIFVPPPNENKNKNTV